MRKYIQDSIQHKEYYAYPKSDKTRPSSIRSQTLHAIILCRIRPVFVPCCQQKNLEHKYQIHKSIG